MIVVYVLSADVLPFGALLLSSMMKYSAPTINAEIFTLKHYHEILTNQSFRDALWNTLILALLSGAACVLIGFLITFMELRRPSVATRLLAFLGVLPGGGPWAGLWNRPVVGLPADPPVRHHLDPAARLRGEVYPLRDRRQPIRRAAKFIPSSTRARAYAGRRP